MSLEIPDSPSGLHPRLRGLLVCPDCRGELDDRADGLVCAACRWRYPVIDGVPRMVPEERVRLREKPPRT